jgi:hypothetical protein
VYNSDQTGASRQHSLFLILPAPVQIEFWNFSFGVKVDGKDLRELFDTKRAKGSRKALQETACLLSIRNADFHQYALVSLIQTFG